MAGTRRERSKHELRCFCRGEPLLAVYGVELDGTLYVHVKIFKQSRLYGETYHTGGTVKIRCRNCLRWNKVTILQPGGAAKLEVTEPPAVAAETQPVQ